MIFSYNFVIFNKFQSIIKCVKEYVVSTFHYILSSFGGY